MKPVNGLGKSSPLKNRIFFLLAVISLLTFNQIAPAQSAEKNKKIIFSSQYTNLQKCESGMTEAEKSAMNTGEDQPLICLGYDNYEIFLASHGCGMQFQVRVRTKEKIKDVAIMEVLDHQDQIYQRNIEWRMANGKPFAVIFTRQTFSGKGDPCLKRKTGEALRVIGLSDRKIDFTINPRTTGNANTKARQLADRSFSTQLGKNNK
jgi:hypothetical protein